MASFNKVILMGNLTRDPELRQTQSGTSVCRFSIAVNLSYNAQDGSSRDETCFCEIDCFGKSAENIAKFFSKGKPILVEGRLRQDSWEDKQTGQKRTKLDWAESSKLWLNNNQNNKRNSRLKKRKQHGKTSHNLLPAQSIKYPE